MRVGDFSVEIIAVHAGSIRELDSGHVVARPGQVYSLRLRNHGPLRAVAAVSIDGHTVTGGGLVLNAWGIVDLERPIHATERGRFTVIAEGDERVFGPDGGRDNESLGLIEARFRRELPPPSRWPDQGHVPLARLGSSPWSDEPRSVPRRRGGEITSLLAASVPLDAPAEPMAPPYVGDAIERAAGTGLTGTSGQDFVPTQVGQLETEATVIQLRLVIGSDEVLAAPRPLPGSTDAAPARPAPRP
jgi:hypothetical protein